MAIGVYLPGLAIGAIESVEGGDRFRVILLCYAEPQAEIARRPLVA